MRVCGLLDSLILTFANCKTLLLASPPYVCANAHPLPHLNHRPPEPPHLNPEAKPRRPSPPPPEPPPTWTAPTEPRSQTPPPIPSPTWTTAHLNRPIWTQKPNPAAHPLPHLNHRPPEPPHLNPEAKPRRPSPPPPEPPPTWTAPSEPRSQTPPPIPSPTWTTAHLNRPIWTQKPNPAAHPLPHLNHRPPEPPQLNPEAKPRRPSPPPPEPPPTWTAPSEPRSQTPPPIPSPTWTTAHLNRPIWTQKPNPAAHPLPHLNHRPPEPPHLNPEAKPRRPSPPPPEPPPTWTAPSEPRSQTPPPIPSPTWTTAHLNRPIWTQKPNPAAHPLPHLNHRPPEPPHLNPEAKPRRPSPPPPEPPPTWTAPSEPRSQTPPPIPSPTWTTAHLNRPIWTQKPNPAAHPLPHLNHRPPEPPHLNPEAKPRRPSPPPPEPPPTWTAPSEPRSQTPPPIPSPTWTTAHWHPPPEPPIHTTLWYRCWGRSGQWAGPAGFLSVILLKRRSEMSFLWDFDQLILAKLKNIFWHAIPPPPLTKVSK